MTTRRPGATRARLNSVSNPTTSAPLPPAQRPKSVLARPTHSQRDQDDVQSTANTPSSSLQRSQEGSETNIKVVLRCRGRSDREQSDNSPSIVQIDGATSNQLTIEASPPVSSLGSAQPPATRTYPFDLVFGPEATQSMVYHDAVNPMLADVMKGYNCTLFAYGQTGTGKTHTMQGDLTPTQMGNPATNAGIIPRVLFRLFNELEKTCLDFVVKVSFMELYNEELRDLLATDFVAPTALTQPMAKDSKSGDSGLKIFDDSNKRGVVIQGLEEIAVKDCKHALNVLIKGSERRQIAATKFNDHSSRSHSIFCITVHMKDKSSMGEDLLKIGKFNLVDLAGSENIGRSGAENKRAREAGMINQSLLTLGRVINALVDKAQHVPYRESKLTRLLQDSLGGRTKTCIIATISPARSNFEETISTLDYALRAKSIRNKPELNQRMTRNALLKEYVAEIERLKADVTAAREKNGIFISEERWNEMTGENENRETELSEAKKRVQIVEDQLRNARDEYELSLAVIKKREEEVQEIRNQLGEAQSELKGREAQLTRMTVAYEEETIVRQAHQQTEVNLDGVANTLRKTVGASVQDLQGLFSKLQRKNDVLSQNISVALDASRVVSSSVRSLTVQLGETQQATQKAVARIEQDARDFQAAECKALDQQLTRLQRHIDGVQEHFSQIDSKVAAEDEAIHAVRSEINGALESIRASFTSWTKEFESTCKRVCDQAERTTSTQLDVLNEAISIMHAAFQNTSSTTLSFLQKETANIRALQASMQTSFAQEISQLQKQNAQLTQTLVDEKKGAEKGKQELLQRISSMLGDFVNSRDESLRSSISHLRQSNEEVQTLLETSHKQHSTRLRQTADNAVKLSSVVSTDTQNGGAARGKANEASNSATSEMSTSMKELRQNLGAAASSHSSFVQKRTQEALESTDEAFESHSRSKRARLESFETLFAYTQDHVNEDQDQLSSLSSRLAAHTERLIAQGQQCSEITNKHQLVMAHGLRSIDNATARLSSEGTLDDVPTGQTPRKRKWQYPAQWERTEDREAVLRKWRGGEAPAAQPGRPPLSFNSKVPAEDEAQPSTHTQPAPEVEVEATLPPERVATPPVPPPSKIVPPSELPIPTEPLVDSRRRNITTRARRAR